MDDLDKAMAKKIKAERKLFYEIGRDEFIKRAKAKLKALIGQQKEAAKPPEREPADEEYFRKKYGIR